MKRILLIPLLILYAFAASAQVNPLTNIAEKSYELLEQGKPDEAYNYWENNATAHQADSLYSYMSALLAQEFLGEGGFSQAELILNEAEKSLWRLKDDNSWWWEQWGYLSTRKALLYTAMHNNILARSSGADAKIAYERISLLGMDYAFALSVLADAALANGQDVFARVFSGQALYIALQHYLKTENKDDYAIFSIILRNCASHEMQLGHYDNAIQSFVALKDLNRQLDYEDPNIDLFLGAAYVGKGDYENAEELLSTHYENCNFLRNKISCGINLLFSKYKLGRTDISQLAYDIAKMQSDNVDKMFSFMSEKEKENWWMSDENDIISIADAILLNSGIKGVNGIIANNEIFSKGLLLRSSNMLRDAVLNSDDEMIVNSYYMLEGLKGELSNTFDKESQSRLETEISSLEKELQRKLNITGNSVSSWQDVASSLSSKEAAIEFIRLSNLDITNAVSEYYAVIVKNGLKEPKIIRLFEEQEIKQILDNTANRRIDRYITELYSAESPQDKGRQLYNLVWKVLDKEIKGCNTVYYSPAGLLNSVSFQAISNGKQSLGQTYVMHLVSSIGEIPNVKSTASSGGRKAVVYGGIQYDAEESEMIQSSRTYSRGVTEHWEAEIDDVRAGWKRLPGTEEEANDISKILTDNGYSVRKYSGIKANEESFKSLSGSGISALHIATHGFFLSKQENIKKNAYLNTIAVNNAGRADPMLRSGLLFSGANRAWQGKRKIEGVEDGILTAKEIAGLNFSKLDLIVLSACQTGLGDVESNEGVYGLQRAFKLAGAKTIIMSLWEVDDIATTLLMKSFYDGYLNGETKDVAFRNATNTVRNYTDKNGNKLYESPYYWAAFIMMD